MQVELKSLQREVGITFIFVTHDQEEAMALSDRIALLRSGRLDSRRARAKFMAVPATAYSPNSSVKPIYSGLNPRWSRHGRADRLAVSRTVRSRHVFYCGRSYTPRFWRSSESLAASTADFRGHIRNQTFGGAMDLLVIDCGNSQTISARVPSPGALSGQQKFEFDAEDAMRVQEGTEA